MTSDYEGKLRYEARYQELRQEAQSGWLLKAAPPDTKGRSSSPAGPQRIAPLAWALVAASIVILVVVVAVAAL